LTSFKSVRSIFQCGEVTVHTDGRFVDNTECLNLTTLERKQIEKQKNDYNSNATNPRVNFKV